jgi:AI-2 transport protein TqsA
LVAMASIVIVVAGMHAANVLLAPIMFAIVLAITISPIIDLLRRRGLPGWLAALIIVLAVVVVGLAVFTVFLSSVNEFRDNIPVYQDRLAARRLEIETWLASNGIQLPDLGPIYQSEVGSIAGAAGTIADWLISSVSRAFVAIFIAVLILLQEPTIRSWLERRSSHDDSLQHRLAEFADVVQKNMVGTALNSLISSVAYTVWLLFFGVDFALMWGLLAFFLGFVPNIGPILAAIGPILVTFIQYGAGTAVIVGAGLLVIHWIIDTTFTMVIGQKVDLSPAASFISFLFWTWVLGPLGALLAFPLTVLIKSILETIDETRWIAGLMSNRGR